MNIINEKMTSAIPKKRSGNANSGAFPLIINATTIKTTPIIIAFCARSVRFMTN
jgi:hypothetical protein